MKIFPELKSKILSKADDIRAEAIQTSHYIHGHPEIGLEEFKSSKRLVQDLENHGFDIEMPLGTMKTAFRARKKGKSKGPTIAFLAEYDALGSLGHACGHNMIGAASTFAAIALSEIMPDLAGEIQVIGTPAEENLGGKIILLEEGVFDNIDAAMMIHPGNTTIMSVGSLAAQVWEFEFKGKPAHAAAMPWAGRNALDALIQMFISVDQLRKQMRPTVRTPGIIAYGGEKPNIVPERAVGQFSLRGKNYEEHLDVVERVKKCAEGAAISTGTTVEYRPLGRIYKDFKCNRILAEIFEKHWLSLGGEIDNNSDRGMGSLDIGNISSRIPCIHPLLKIAPRDVANHTREFAECSKSDVGDKQLIKGIKCLAITALEILINPEIIEEMKLEIRSLKD
jgi:amidohydrolase